MNMKIVTWNSHFGLDATKAQYINGFLCDLYVIQECTVDDIERLEGTYKYCKWYGDNIDSKYGIGIYSNIFKIELLNTHNVDFRFIVPFRISNENIETIIFVIWTKDKDKNNKKIEYTEQLWEALNYNVYEEYLLGSILIIGDFNSNNFWNKQYRQKIVPSHYNILSKLKSYNIKSAYHEYNNCENGKEKEPTLLWKKDINNQFHIDYCFFSNDFIVKNVQVLSINEWMINKYSDHCPLIIELEHIINSNNQYKLYLDHDLNIIQKYFHELIINRSEELIKNFKIRENSLPIITNVNQKQKCWFPIPGMYGGFSYQLFDKNNKPLLISESWCRIVGGSGQRHEITVDECKLVDEGFV